MCTCVYSSHNISVYHYLFRKHTHTYIYMQVVIAAWATRGYKRRNFIANDTIPTQAPQLRARSPPCIPLHIHNVRGFRGTVTRSPRNSINERKGEGGGGGRGSEIEIGSFHVLARSFLLLLPSPPPPTPADRASTLPTPTRAISALAASAD